MLLAIALNSSSLYVCGQENQFTSPCFGYTHTLRIDAQLGLYLSQIPHWNVGVAFPIKKLGAYAGTEGYLISFTAYDELGNEVSKYNLGTISFDFGASKKLGIFLAGLGFKTSYEMLGGSSSLGASLEGGLLLKAPNLPVTAGFGFEGVGISSFEEPTFCIFAGYKAKKAAFGAKFGLEVAYTGCEARPVAFSAVSFSVSYRDSVGIGASFGDINSGLIFFVKPFRLIKLRTKIPELNVAGGYSFITGTFNLLLGLKSPIPL